MKAACGAVAALALLWAAPARAATCGVVEVQAVAFGAYNPFSGASGSATGYLTYVCSLFNIFDRVTVDLSPGAAGSYLPWRTLMSGSHALNYNLYLDATFTQVWGNGSGSTFHFGPQALPILPTRVFVYGYIPPSQNAWEGSYEDTITITLTF
ncbi:MAG: SCPU domain-containing protein [Myxococcales bacterium]|nr:MAG: SCPU domain-containing protein [Myxococcales bacterium]